MVDSGFAHRACRKCHSRKIRCDRRLPICRACSENSRSCTYEAPTQPSASRRYRGESRDVSILPSPQSTADSTPALGPGEPALDPFAETAISFLDEDVFHRTLLSESCHPLDYATPDYVLAFIDGPATMRTIACAYFDTSSTWLPILPKARFFASALTPLRKASLETYFVCLCMSLHTEPLPDDQSARETARYKAACRLFGELQVSPMHSSLAVLQGRIIVLAYEIGHAVYPNAFIGVAICVQLATAMGLGFKDVGCDTHVQKSPAMALRGEEEKREWWAIYILERIANVGRIEPRLLTPEPCLSTALPSNDQDWQKGRVADDSHTLGTPSSDVGGFAGNARAAYLLSCAFIYNGDRQKRSTALDGEDSSVQLTSTIHAQLEVIKTLSEASTPIECTSSAICHCALIVLSRSPKPNEHPHEHEDPANAALEVVSRTALWIARCFNNQSAEKGSIPPYMLPWLYTAAKHFLSERSIADYEAVKTALQRLRWFWRAADVYLKLLEAHEVTVSPRA